MPLSNRYQYLIRFAYIGTNFYGVQALPDFPTAGGSLQRYLEQVSGLRPKALCFTARTDRGVHAHENYATCWFKEKPSFAIPILPQVGEADGLIIRSITQVPYNVYARTLAKTKIYHYVIEDGASMEDVRVPNNRFAWKIHPVLNEGWMREAANHLVGEHDFSSFRGAKCEAGTTVKNLVRLDVKRCRNQIHFTIEADAFLRKMIRNLVGYLAEIGSGLKPPNSVPTMLLKKKRSAAGIMAPPQGLTLERIILADSISKLI